MTPTRQKLLDLITEPDLAYDQPAAELGPLQLRSAQELFEERIEQIPLLRKRAEDAGINTIRETKDLVPLLFAHTAYKSYPRTFIDRGHWGRMLEWLNTLSVAETRDIDISGVKNVDDWLDRLWDAGHCVLATSGSSGKCSFLNATLEDRKLKARHFRNTTGWPFTRAKSDRPIFLFGPIKGYNSAIEAVQLHRENWGRADAIYCLSEEPLLISEVSRVAAMRKKMAEGKATPKEIADFNATASAKAAAGVEAARNLSDKILDHRQEPIFVSAMWAQQMMIIARARERGIRDGDFHQDSIIMAGGGIKNIALPADYKEQVDHFYGKVIRPGTYGMTELSQVMPRCEAGRYHHAPGLIWLITNESGERLLGVADAGADGFVSGRFAYLDLLFEGRWGGILTGDKVTVDFAEICPCGRNGPTLLDNITRFAQTGQDDHIGCAGTIDSYIRGVLNT